MSLKNPQGSGRIMMTNNRVHHTVNNSNMNAISGMNNATATVAANIILNTTATNNNSAAVINNTNNNNNNRNMTALNNIERLLDESLPTFRHKKMLQNIVNVVKATELLDEYRQMVRFLQNSCGCKKSKNIVEQIGMLEKRYQDYCSASEASKGLCIDTNHAQITGALSPVSLPANANKVLVTQKLVNQSGKTVAYTTTASANTSKAPFVNYAVFNQTLKNNSNNRQDDSTKAHNNANMNMSIHNINSINNNNAISSSNNANNNNNNSFVTSRNNGTKNYIEYKVPVVEEQAEDEPDEEYDIAEYMILAEMLEREKNKLVRERDPKNEYIVVVRDTTTKDTICYECIVGGKCGFLSRERNQMLFHLSKHFENENQSSEEDEDEDSKEDVDISIIPVNPDDILHEDKASPLPYKQSTGNDASDKLLAQQLKMQLMALQQEQDNEQNSSSEQTGYKRLIYCNWANCNFNCDQNYKLRTHIRQVHQKLRPYLCDWPGCYGAYKTRSNLASHRMVHTGERPFICDYPDCGAKFARKYDCERHRRIHCEKMYACEWPGCGKRLCDPYNLERHMMVHKGELPYRCPIGKCIRGFRELRYLRDHMVNAHQCLPDTVQLKMAYVKGSSNNESESDKNSCEDNDLEETSIVKKLLVSGTNSNNNNNNTTVTIQSPSQSSTVGTKKAPGLIPARGTKRQISAINHNNNKATTSKNVITIDSELEDDETKTDTKPQTDDNNNVNSMQVKQEVTEEPKFTGKQNNINNDGENTKNLQNKEEDTKTASSKIEETKINDSKPSPIPAISTRRSKRVRNK